jgi:hypothetical protein
VLINLIILERGDDDGCLIRLFPIGRGSRLRVSEEDRTMGEAAGRVRLRETKPKVEKRREDHAGKFLASIAFLVMSKFRPKPSPRWIYSFVVFVFGLTPTLAWCFYRAGY